MVPEEGWLQPKSQNNMIRRVCMGERLDSIEAIVERYCVASSPAKSKVYIGLGILLIIFAAIGIWVPGWPTVSWAVPAAFLFSMSSESMFKWTLTNRFFGAAMFEYYATGKTIPKHAKLSVMGLIALMTFSSATFVWYVSTLGDGQFMDPGSWNGADPGYGTVAILLVGMIGVWWLYAKVKIRE
ncbi:MAG: hypothetical protein CMB26_02350 [Euryarchaeota archaeon]|nr:hypothetical protein [Euryarchaeota archaeon]